MVEYSSVYCTVTQIYILLLYVFFFFKQKTAYEIGTGDWSSDVCSSDVLKKHAIQQGDKKFFVSKSFETSGGLTPLTSRISKIGRASCRERV